jgi:hypothetical protein
MKVNDTIQDGHSVFDGERRSNHPAFAQVGASRVSGGVRLYGSDFVHNNYIVLRIERSEVSRHLSNDWHFSGNTLIEIAMSEAQWATMISTLNMGQGTPCTLQRLEGERVPEIEVSRVAVDDFRDEVKETTSKAAALVAQTIEAVRAEMGKGLSKKRSEAILGLLEQLGRTVGSSVDFVQDQFGRHIEQQIEKAKIEISAYAQGAALTAGSRDEVTKLLTVEGTVDDG